MFEIAIGDNVYQFNFGIGFVREINRTMQRVVDGMNGVKEDVGLMFTVAKIIDGDAVALVDALYIANKGKTPRITKEILEKYIDDEDTDIEKLFKDVMAFLAKANATKKVTQKLMKVAEAQESK